LIGFLNGLIVVRTHLPSFIVTLALYILRGLMLALSILFTNRTIVGGVKEAAEELTAFCATVFAACQVLEFGSAASDRGLLKEFEAIIAAVIGGCLLTGGYCTVVGACFGALIYGVVRQGIEFIQVPNDWFRVFLGGMLLIAVLFNNLLRRRIVSGS
jgi:simple sugar transport system permease protein